QTSMLPEKLNSAKYPLIYSSCCLEFSTILSLETLYNLSFDSLDNLSNNSFFSICVCFSILSLFSKLSPHASNRFSTVKFLLLTLTDLNNSSMFSVLCNKGIVVAFLDTFIKCAFIEESETISNAFFKKAPSLAKKNSLFIFILFALYCNHWL